ncbi:unnamed protein product [Ectocarpus sp. CCAP 1310/34]|nr:unnamed protein product [Ectocarpus sp. CCAP 1310/34]
MGKANRGGQKRKEAPARKQLQGKGGNSGLLHKNNHKHGAHRAAGFDGAAAMGKRTLAQQLLQPNKRARGGKRRRKSSGTPSKPGSSETAVIQAEYAAVDAREKAKEDSEKARRVRAPVRIRLAPSTTELRMPSEGEVSMASLRASSSARMVEALLQSITDEPAPDAPPSRPVRSAGRKRKGNPFAALEDDGSDSDSDSDHGSLGAAGGRVGIILNGRTSNSKPAQRTGGLFTNSTGCAFGSGPPAEEGGGLMAFASPSSFAGFAGAGGGTGARGMGSVGFGGSKVGALAGATAAVATMGAGPQPAASVASVGGGAGNSDDDDDDDSDL